MTTRVAATAVIHPGVDLGDDVVVEEYCVLGAPFRGGGNARTVIGDGARIRSHTVIYAGNRIGHRFQTGNKANVRELNVIGDDVSIGTLSVVEHRVSIADGVRIHSQAFVPEHTILEEGAWIGPNAVLTNARYPLAPGTKENLEGPKVGAGARIGANATILPGIRIGPRALVGAGSVVTREVEAEVIVAGNPARPIGRVDY